LGLSAGCGTGFPPITGGSGIASSWSSSLWTTSASAFLPADDVFG